MPIASANPANEPAASPGRCRCCNAHASWICSCVRASCPVERKPRQESADQRGPWNRPIIFLSGIVDSLCFDRPTVELTERLARFTQEKKWPRIAVVGAGAVGCYFGGMLARAGAPVTLIGRRPFVEAVEKEQLFLDTLQFSEKVKVAASVDPAAAKDAELILFSVKGYDTEAVAAEFAGYLAPSTIVLSLQNGVDNTERLRAAGVDAVAAVVYVAVSVKAPGHVKHVGRGDLVIGDLYREQPSRRPLLHALATLFSQAGIPCRVSDSIEVDLWRKMVMNCAYNAISALGRARYCPLMENEYIRPVFLRAIEEVLAVARAAGVMLPEAEITGATQRLWEAMPDATSSTAQDIQLGKRTEIDSLNGYVVRLGAQHDVATPVNQTLHALVKLLEPR